MAIKDPALIGFFSSASQKKYKAGEIVLRGEDPSGVICIKSGFVKVYSISDEGDKYIHVIYKAGELFPLIWALRGMRRKVFYEATSDAVVSEASKEDFIDFIKSNPSPAYDALTQLAEQFYMFADSLDNLQYKSAHERVAFRLVFLAGRFGVRKKTKIVIDVPMTHELLSESINLARETVSREIEKLERRGIIGREHGNIVINDIHKMSKEFGEPVSLDLWGLES